MDFGAHLLLSFIYISITTDPIRHQLATNTKSTHRVTPDILRYIFASDSTLPPVPRNASKIMTREEQLELWNSSLYRIGMNTSYNSSSTSTSTTTLCANPDKKTNTQWNVFSKDELDLFSQSSDSDSDQTSDSDSDQSSDPDNDNDLDLSPNPDADHHTYIDDHNNIKGSLIFVSPRQT